MENTKDDSSALNVIAGMSLKTAAQIMLLGFTMISVGAVFFYSSHVTGERFLIYGVLDCSWFMVVLGICTSITGTYYFIMRPKNLFLVIDPSGLHWPKKKLHIPWEQVSTIRAFARQTNEDFVPAVLAVRVFSLVDIPQSYTVRGECIRIVRSHGLDEDEIPILLPAGKYNLDELLATIQSYIPKDNNEAAG